jgi:hypothetical protein
LKRAAASSLFLIGLATVLFAQSLAARIDRDQLHIGAPRLHFLIGEALDRLRDGATVRYELQLAARNERNGKVLARSIEHFAVSYDLWEEKFAISKLGPAPRSVSHLSAAAAEAWCIDNTSLPVSAFAGTASFWLRLDYQADNPAATSAEPPDNSGFTLSGLIDIFSRRTRPEQVHGFEEAGPLRLENLKKK